MEPFIYASLILYGTGFFASLVSRKAPALGKVSGAVLALGLAAHTAALGVRMYATGHAPMASMYETLVFFSWAVVLVTLIVVMRYAERTVELITVPVAVVALLFATGRAEPGGPLSLILKTIWFELHVTTSFAAYALFTLAFAGAVLYLAGSFGDRADEGVERDLRKYQDVASRSVLWGFLFFSGSMFSGAVWGYLAWGAYWMWEPKIIWSFIVWFYYAGAMHAWYVREWRGRGLAVATVIGFFVVLFTYLGVGMLMKSSHSFGM